jgi:hypothetical protein
LQQWLVTYTLHFEVALAGGSLALGIVALPFLVFGSLAALGSGPPGEGADLGTSILGVGALSLLAGVVVLGVLAVTLLVDTGVDVRRHGLPSTDGLDALAFVSGVTRAVETLFAGAFLAGLIGAVVSVGATGQLPDIVSAILVLSGLLLPAVVLVHAAGASVGYLLGVDETGDDSTAVVR